MAKADCEITEIPVAMRDRTLLLVGAKFLFWLFFLIVYLPRFAAGHARITFGVTSADADYTRAQCEALSSCGDNHDAFEWAQMTLMRTVAGEIWVTTIALLLLESIFLVMMVIHLMGRGTTARTAMRWWRLQLVVVVLSLAVYLSLLGIGAVALHRIPENARLGPYQAAFSSPFTDVAMLYYASVFIAVNTLSLVHNRALARRAGPSSRVDQGAGGRVDRRVTPPSP
ncbi:hypothetical protein RB614_15445 [Phytohabitans sp. ZYX-F-186]|uniref:DUF2975 domain-containing protein n=1 Tax=Phytohabitans maris TaxID=3071409 RepID=A0ABU0ZFS6_9ACTN|nr:hypothetical protein [Phytohabitans sp. ZYX-F-186]MDQ7905911.1 hypothetical protein [Phytohabitans sp. ZYX-F-186]